MHIPGGEVDQRARALILMLYAHRLPRARRFARVDARPRLNAGLLIRTDHVVVRAERCSLPQAMVQIQHAPLSRRSSDRAGRSSSDGTTGEWRRGPASAR